MYCSTPLSLRGGSSGMYFEFSRQKAVVSPPLYHLVGYGAAAATGGGGGRGLIFMLPPLPPREDTGTGNGITWVILILGIFDKW